MIQFYARKLLQTTDGIIPLELSFTLEKGQVLSIYGASGVGKTTVLRILAGLTDTEKSKIIVDHEIWNNSERKYFLSTQKRSIGFVFQEFSLFPNFSIRQNLEFALSNGKDKKIVEDLLDLMELRALESNKPENLSGGQKQRVALARAVVRQPKILLLDEPLSALDNAMRLKLQDYILEAHKRYALTTILVSHHLPEIFKLSDNVIVLDKGKIVKEGRPGKVFSEDKLSSTFKLAGEIVDIQKNDMGYTISVHTGSSIVKIVATEEEQKKLKQGQKVIVSSEVFNPIIQALD